VQTLAAVGDTLSTEGDLDRILQVVCEMVADTFGALLCSIMAVDREATLLEIKAVNSRSPERLNKLPLKVDESLIGRVVRERRLLVVPDVSMEELYSDPDYARRAGLTSLVSAPLIAGSSVTGALNVYTRDRRAFSDEELGFVRAVAGQVSLVFENSRLMAETLEMKRALETRKLVERAKGILQQRNGLSEEQAYLELRNESRRLRRPMRTLAEAIVLAESLHRKAETTDQAGDPKSRAAADGSGAPH
jgi:uroporphyrinogen-III synthase